MVLLFLKQHLKDTFSFLDDWRGFIGLYAIVYPTHSSLPLQIVLAYDFKIDLSVQKVN